MKSPTEKVGQLIKERPQNFTLVELYAITSIKLFSTLISPADGPRSPSFPTGTAYGIDAIQEHGLLAGLLLIGDRLFHEADVHKGPIIILHDKQRYYDPVESNTFWWSQNPTQVE
ncbi:MAG: membrane protein insertion efficiency factor YidD [Proteobacteria bacterium]|nr:membrane protein insertion efficiency factor YidD [Pseudomonadota bacterium]